MEWKRDPRRLVGFFGYRRLDSMDIPTVSSASLETERVASGSGPFSLLSDRAMFIHQKYLDATQFSRETSCCHLLLSMQIAAGSPRAPIVMKSRPRELLDTNPIPDATSLRGGQEDQAEGCSSQCTSRWLQQIESNLLREGKTVLG